jgi:hypothetical protein
MTPPLLIDMLHYGRRNTESARGHLATHDAARLAGQ